MVQSALMGTLGGAIAIIVTAFGMFSMIIALICSMRILLWAFRNRRAYRPATCARP